MHCIKFKGRSELNISEIDRVRKVIELDIVDKKKFASIWKYADEGAARAIQDTLYSRAQLFPVLFFYNAIRNARFRDDRE